MQCILTQKKITVALVNRKKCCNVRLVCNAEKNSTSKHAAKALLLQFISFKSVDASLLSQIVCVVCNF